MPPDPISMSVVTDWVRPGYRSDGRDPLALQAECQQLYGQLVPGLTNQTLRPIYYMFYPWLVWACAQRDVGLSLETLRRAEALLAWTGAFRERHTMAPAQGLAGIRRMRAAAAASDGGESLSLSSQASAYLKRGNTALGQVYLSPLRTLGLLAGSSSAPRCTDLGGELAQAYDAAAPADALFYALEADTITRDTLESLCGLFELTSETTRSARELLVGQLLCNARGHQQRRDTIALLLDLLDRGHPLSSRSAQAALYTGSLAGNAWTLPERHEPTRNDWARYVRAEMFASTCHALFQSLLALLRESRFESTTHLQHAIHRELASEWLGERARQPLADAMVEAREALPHLHALDDPDHEWARQGQLGDGGIAGDPTACVPLVVDQLLTFMARGDTTSARHTAISPSIASDDISLTALDAHGQPGGRWQGMTLGTWLGWIARHWVLEKHLRVALRKLADDSKDTFAFRPTLTGLVFEHPISLDPTSPRLRTTINFLQNLGLALRDDDGELNALSPEGQRWHEEVTGG